MNENPCHHRNGTRLIHHFLGIAIDLGSTLATLVNLNLLRENLILLAIQKSKTLIAPRRRALFRHRKIFEYRLDCISAETVSTYFAKRRSRNIWSKVTGETNDVTGLTRGVKVIGQRNVCVTPPISSSSSESESSPFSAGQCIVRGRNCYLKVLLAFANKFCNWRHGFVRMMDFLQVTFIIG